MSQANKIFVCNFCKAEFTSRKTCKSRTPKFCGRACCGQSKKLNIKCLACNQIIQNETSGKISNRKYCSRDCAFSARRGVKLSIEWRQRLSEGRKKSNKCKGPNLYNWKGGKETERFRLKQSYYKRKNSLKESMPYEYLQRLLTVQENKCFYCECELNDYKAIEHLTPVSRGGDNQFYNLVYSCKSCNSNKRTKTLEEYVIINNRYDLIDKFDYLIACTYEN